MGADLDLLRKIRRGDLLADYIAALDAVEALYRDLDTHTADDFGLSRDEFMHAHADAFMAYNRLAHGRQAIEGGA